MRYIVLILLLSLSCKTTSKNSQNSVNEEMQGVFREEGREVTGESIKITVRNTSNVAQYILDPMKKNIEQNIDGEWKSVSVLYCDCGGPPCPAPPGERPVEANGTFRFTWDLNEERCESTENGRTTIKKKVEGGKYRVAYRYKSEGGAVEKMFINFTVE